MVSVAHVAERVIVAHEAAGSIPVGHPSQTARSSLGIRSGEVSVFCSPALLRRGFIKARSSEGRGREFESLRAGPLPSL